MRGKVLWYEELNGDKPVEDFLLAMENRKHRGKILSWIDFLEKMGITLRDPYTSQVEGRLRELKADFGKFSYRILYYWDVNQNIVLLHAFLKKSNRIPEHEKTIALKRMREDMHQKRKD